MNIQGDIVFSLRRITSLSEEMNRHVLIFPYCLLDCFRVFFRVDECFPGIEVPRFVIIGVCDVVEFFQADYIEEVVSVCDLPRIEQRRILLVAFPEIQGCVCPVGFFVMRMTRNCDPFLVMYRFDNFFDGKGGIHIFLDIDRKDVIIFVRELGSGDDKHVIFFPRSSRFVPELLEVRAKVYSLYSRIASAPLQKGFFRG